MNMVIKKGVPRTAFLKVRSELRLSLGLSCSKHLFILLQLCGFASLLLVRFQEKWNKHIFDLNKYHMCRELAYMYYVNENTSGLSFKSYFIKHKWTQLLYTLVKPLINLSMKSSACYTYKLW